MFPSLFPDELRDRLFNGDDDSASSVIDVSTKKHRTGKHALKNFLLAGHGVDGEVSDKKNKPIADLFPETTIMFAGESVVLRNTNLSFGLIKCKNSHSFVSLLQTLLASRLGAQNESRRKCK